MMTLLAPVLDFAGLTSVTMLLILALAGLLGGLVRGFTGFGFAMIFVPIATLAVGPVMAVGMIWFVDIPFALPVAASGLRRTHWREVLPLLAGATLLIPVGVWLLTELDPLVSRWIIALAILAAVAALASGWRYRGEPSVSLSLGVGSLSGLASGMAQLGGMPLAVFWLAAQKNDPRQTRDNLNSYFGIAPFISGLFLWWGGVLTLSALKAAMLVCLPYAVGLIIGSKLFHIASEQTFRRLAYGVITIAAIAAIPF